MRFINRIDSGPPACLLANPLGQGRGLKSCSGGCDRGKWNRLRGSGKTPGASWEMFRKGGGSGTRRDVDGRKEGWLKKDREEGDLRPD